MYKYLYGTYNIFVVLFSVQVPYLANRKTHKRDVYELLRPEAAVPNEDVTLLHGTVVNSEC